MRVPKTLSVAVAAIFLATIFAPVAAQENSEPFVIVQHFQHPAYSWDDDMTPKIEALETVAESCGLHLFWDFAGKFNDFGETGGTLVVVDGHYDLSDGAAATLLAATQLCFPDAYLKRLSYMGE